jgi:hypothetical protein
MKRLATYLTYVFIQRRHIFATLHYSKISNAKNTTPYCIGSFGCYCGIAQTRQRDSTMDVTGTINMMGREIPNTGKIISPLPLYNSSDLFSQNSQYNRFH